jgi:hypothetical protein
MIDAIAARIDQESTGIVARTAAADQRENDNAEKDIAKSHRTCPAARKLARIPRALFAASCAANMAKARGKPMPRIVQR